MSDEPERTESSDDVKTKYREALERKRKQNAPGNGDGHDDGKIHGTHGAAGGQRTFRRKSG